MKYDAIVVGAGFAGATVANRLAAKGQKVLVIDQREHVAGNAYDYEKKETLIHMYGPHIFHTNSKEVFDYLSNFTSWYPYEHRVLGHIDNKIVPIPFNFKSIDVCMSEKAEKLKSLLIRDYGENKKVPIMDLLKNEDEDIKELANFIFEKVFKYYTMKQWGLRVEDLDSAVSARVPVNTSYDDRYFADAYQYMPASGYTKIIENMLNNMNIEVRLGVKSKDVLTLEGGQIRFEDVLFEGEVYYTGMLDELFGYKLGELPYRSLNLVLEELQGTFQTAATENYPCPKEERAYTRITEYKHFLEKKNPDVTFIHTEYPMAYETGKNTPFYPIFSESNQAMYGKYVELAKQYKKLHLIGRLAEYKYYNMDAIVLKALELTK